ncbi:Transcriptional regulator of ribosomal biogenesis proteins, partial [Pleosporales sp. CAS-2024a]
MPPHLSCTAAPAPAPRRTPPAVKLDSHAPSPPPLSHSPRESTAASTPITTPVQQPASPHFARPKHDAHAWHRRPHELVAARLPDTELLFEDAADGSFALFPDTHRPAPAMADMHTPPRYGSHSPQNLTSNLTSALREAREANHHPQAPAAQAPAAPHPLNPTALDGHRPPLADRNPSISMLGSSFYGTATGARPISMKDRPRRESNQMGSFAGGLSWGGVSVGSWIRD